MSGKLTNCVTLDLGSSKIATIIVHTDKKGKELVEYNLFYVEGFKSGNIFDMQATEDSIAHAIYSLENAYNTSISSIDVSISGLNVKSCYSVEKIKIAEQAVTESDVRKLLQKMINNIQSDAVSVIHYFPIEFLVDDNQAVENPIGMSGSELICRLHTINADSNLLFNINTCLAKCDITINNFVLGIYASALACLTEEEKNLGTIIIDIGSHTTSIGIMLGNKLIFCEHINLGGWNITCDIAKILSISLKTAEKFKVLYGDASPMAFKDSGILRIEDFEPNNQYNPNLAITIGQLARIINARVEEILQIVYAALETSAINHLIAPYVVVTGGSAALKSLKDVATNIFKRPVRIAKNSQVIQFENIANPTMYTAAIGMVLYNEQQKRKSLINSELTHISNNWFKKLISIIKLHL